MIFLEKKSFFLIIFFLLVVNIFFYGKERIVILNLKNISVEENLANIITESLITSFVKMGTYEVVERSQIDKIFNELNLTNKEEFSESEVLEIGALSKAKIIVIGSVGRLLNNYIVNIRFVSVETGKIIYADKIVAKNTNELLNVSDIIVSNFKKEVQNLEKEEKKDKKTTKIATKDTKDMTKDMKDKKETTKITESKSDDFQPKRLNSNQKAAIALIIVGSSINLVGTIMFIFDNIYFPSEKEKAEDYYKYKDLETLDFGFFIGGIVFMSVGAILALSSIPLFIIKPKKNISFNIDLGRELSFYLKFEFDLKNNSFKENFIYNRG